ncbi:MAG TPA: MarP family serine protease [Euzebyales bacterium]
MLNGFDYLLLIVLVAVCVRGGRLGGLSQVASYGIAAVGLLVGAVIAPGVAALLADGPGPTLSLLTLTILLVCLLAAQSVGIAIGIRLRRAAARAGAGGVDAAAGIGVAALSLVLAVWLLAAPLSRGPFQSLANTLRDSRLVNLISDAFPAPPDVIARVGTYLDQQGFPEVFSDFQPDVTAPPAPTPRGSVVAAAQAAAERSVVQVEAAGCDSISSGSGFVTRPGVVVTNAHVVAGGESIAVRDPRGRRPARVVLFDPRLDLAVLSAPSLRAPALPWVGEVPDRGLTGATLGFSGGSHRLTVKPAAVRRRVRAQGRDIYGRQSVRREVLILADPVTRGDSGGPFVTADGEVAGVVFAAAVDDPSTGYALAADSIRDIVAEGAGRTRPVDTGACRFD